MKPLLRSLLAGYFILPGVCLAATQAHKIDCKAQFKYSTTNVQVSASYLKAVSATVGVTTTPAQVAAWTTAVLDQQLALCQLYASSTDAQMSTSEYLTRLDALQTWTLEIVKIAATSEALNAKQAAASAGGKGPSDPEVDELKNSLAAQVKSTLSRGDKTPASASTAQ